MAIYIKPEGLVTTNNELSGMMMMILFSGRVLPRRGTGPCPRRRRA